ncbi:trigger factor [Mariniluteicoccus flavus]
MPSTVEKLSPSRVKITVEVPFAELKPALEKAYRDIASQVNIPGFRAGKVPPMVIDQRFGRGVVLQEAINAALPEQYSKAITESGLNPLGEPEVEVTKLEDNDVVEFTAEVDVRPEFTVPAFDKVSVEVDPIDVTDDQVDEQIETLRQRFGTMKDVDRAAGEDDVVTIDLVGAKNGEQLEEATAEGIQYKLGSGGMLDGLDEAVTGLKAGESKEFTSELVGGPLRGEKVDITVTVAKVQEQELPEVDDEFAQMVSEFDTADEMRDDLKKSLGQMGRLEQAANARDKVLEAVIADVDIDLPTTLLEAETNARHEQIQQQLAQAGLTLDQYLEDGDTDQTAEEFWAEVDERSADALKAQIVLDQVADDNEIGVDQNDMTQHIIRKAQQNGTSPDQEAQHMMEHNHMAEWMTEIRRGKALALMVEAAKVTDTDGNDLNLKNLRGDGTYADEDDAEGDPAVELADSADAGEAEADTADEKKADEKKADKDSDA